MNIPWWERPMCFFCNFWWIIFVSIILLISILFAIQYWLPHNTPGQNTLPAPIATTRVENFENPYLTPVISAPAIVGTEMPTDSMNADWQSYSNPVMKISLKYPKGWKLLENVDKHGFALYPPEADVTMPSEHISFDFMPDRAYDETTPVYADKTGYQTITINDLSGMEYKDSSLSIPGQTYYIELSHQAGTLLIGATMGPNISLVSQLREILKTMEVIP